MDETTTKILQALVERGVFTDKSVIPQIEQQLEEGLTLNQALVETELVDGEVLAQLQAELLELPYIDLREKTITPEVLNVIPESTARGHMIIAFEETAEVLKVAMVDVNDRQIVEFIRKKVDKPVEVNVASMATIRVALSRYQQSLEVELDDVVNEELKNVVTEELGTDLAEVAEDLPIIRVTQAILKHAILEGASDIHIEPTEKEVIVRYRVDGILRDALVLQKNVLAGIIARIKVLANLKIDEHRLPQDGRFKIESDDYKVAFRVSTLPVFDGEKVVMRLLDESSNTLGLDDLGIRSEPLEIFRRAINRPHGMILITGPTGSGKTTTLYAVMKELSTPDVNISTIEDPIEYRMQRVNQTQVQPKIGLTFANGLRALVRQDPDIIMVGEIRDEETASLAVNAALTGHLVLSTLHTNSAAGALPRLRDMHVEAFLLASTLNLIAAQRLVRRLCDKCKKTRPATKEIIDDLSKEFDTDVLLEVLKHEKAVAEGASWNDVELHEAVGCKQCSDSGYKGRVGIYEVLDVTPEIQELVKPTTTSSQLEEAARKYAGFVSMAEDGLYKVVTGVTSLEEVLRVARE